MPQSWDKLGDLEVPVAQAADLIKFGTKITVGNSFCGRFGVIRDKKRPQPGKLAYPTVNFAQSLGQSGGFGGDGDQNGRFGQVLFKVYSRK